jgi:hypothetical protein
VIRWPVAVWLALAGLIGVKLGSGAAAESLGRWVGAGLSRVIVPTNLEGQTVDASAVGRRERGPKTRRVSQPVSAPETPQPAKTKTPRRSVPLSAQRPSPQSRSFGILVRARTVLRLAEAGARPEGTPVAQSPEHPAGILLRGVTSMGIGLRDGDILVRAAGQPVTEPGAVISAVISARGARMPIITGQFWRDGRIHPIAVEQPYLQPTEQTTEESPAELRGFCGQDGDWVGCATERAQLEEG